ncbi:hypothetical protein [Sphingomonas sp. M1-B02]|uniref:hypothetical protein n=1 Tax=Sphingomonas sp. M1-B02 TaxID=3114300 RepID=UPI00223FD3B5|nr:hypothetical protein [Sphingomonas sp. S6-11]UZK64880.1 hypothetical protein OKW87_10110 [Sphingomonas sp. S6-11]
MRKQLTLTTAMAAGLLALPGCASQQNEWDDVVAEQDTAICVDKEGKRVEDNSCAPRNATGNYGGGSAMTSAFLWYYLGRNMAMPYYGESVNRGRYAGQGSYQPRPGVNYAPAPPTSRMTRSQAVRRGGLGSSARSFGGGRS